MQLPAIFIHTTGDTYAAVCTYEAGGGLRGALYEADAVREGRAQFWSARDGRLTEDTAGARKLFSFSAYRQAGWSWRIRMEQTEYFAEELIAMGEVWCLLEPRLAALIRRWSAYPAVGSPGGD